MSDQGSGGYRMTSNIPVDVHEGSETRMKAPSDMKQLIAAMARVEKKLDALQHRTERLERALGASRPPSAVPPPTESELAVKGAKFWIVTGTTGGHNAHEVFITGREEDFEAGVCRYKWKRVDGETRGPLATPRTADQIFRTEQEALLAPRSVAGSGPSSAKNVAVRMTRKSKAFTMPPKEGKD